MTSLDDAVSDLMLIERNLTNSLADLDAMGIHLSCDKTPLSKFIKNLISLKGFYADKAYAEKVAKDAREIARAAGAKR